MGAALLKAFDDGMDNDLDPGDPEERNIYAAMDAGKIVKKLPMSLGDALIELENDEVVKSSMPGEMYTVYHGHKKDEWERFNQTVTNWDTETYLDCLP
jgi:glutamine synthetase